MLSSNCLAGINPNVFCIRDKMRKIILVTLSFAIWMLSAAAANAAELCVTPGGTGGCYALPSQAVEAAVAGDTIRIKSGTYLESVTINIILTDLRIIGDNPVNTVVKNSIFSNVFTVQSSGAEIANLTITGGKSGISVSTTGSVATIHHNIIRNNAEDGITSPCCGSSARFIAFNNIVMANNRYGILGFGYGEPVYNNIVFGNGSTGIRNSSASYNSSYNNASTGNSNYSGTTSNIGNISLDCLFVDVAGSDFRLQSTSPCMNTGNPGYFDVDGSISDMGSFGGPASALFWPYGNGGPVVTNLVVDPPIVPEGGTLSIRATVEIR